jgi:Fur family peroxide stress response transcriptional regulator
MLKRSKQRDCIQAFLATRYDHPTAETVYLNIREEFPNISLATVYRNLSLLADLGEIQKISTGSGPDRFDGKAAPHNHFICRDCGSVMDLNMDSITHVDEIAGKDFAGRIEGHSILFHGLCPECLKNELAKTS